MLSFSNITAILPAAGVGRRMKYLLPKQYLTISGKTLLEHSIRTLLSQPCINEVIVAINPNDCWYHQLPIATNIKVRSVIGGRKRVNSVIAALHLVEQESWVLIHDAVRPCLHQDDLSRLISQRIYTDVGAVLATPVRDTLKREFSRTGLINHTVERNNLWHSLTPQIFICKLLINCLKQAISDGIQITDESSAVEYCGYHPLIVPGRADNIKVTFPEDLAIANLFFKLIKTKREYK